MMTDIHKANEPKDTDKKKYLYSCYAVHSLEYIIEAAKAYFPNTDIKDIRIGTEYIHIYCIGYDSYDPGDWAIYITFEID